MRNPQNVPRYLAQLGVVPLIAGGCSGVTVDVTGVIENTLTDDPVSGAEICLLEDEDVACSTTNEAGEYTLVDVPGDSEHAVTVTKADWVTAIGAFVTGEEDLELGIGGTVENNWADAQFQLFGLERDLQMGHIAAYFDDGIDGNNAAVEGVSIALSPDPGVDPSYIDGGTPDESATATTASGLVGVYNAEPGDYTVTLTGLPDGCTVDWGWGELPEVRLPVRENALSALWVTCSSE